MQLVRGVLRFLSLVVGGVRGSRGSRGVWLFLPILIRRALCLEVLWGIERTLRSICEVVPYF